MMDELAEPPSDGMLGGLQKATQRYLDKTTIWVRSRWSAFVVLLVVYAVRVYILQGFFIVTYGLGIYLLNLLIGFLSPAVDPDLEGPGLPTTDREEFRPFDRKLPEFKFWMSAFRAVLSAFTMTFFSAFDLPVFWPILFAYFLVLVFLTLKDRVRHMLKHRYVPISMGKQTYGELTKTKASGGGGEKDSK
eukprot:CAMPEP_0176079346 /NCGR_PEP_ID=MMETSP0120_2-20121206/39684_1 /TAXON_ID=160619 /ORGANISM="Kryptoperidinium foliaceum, Strain CCMP 1326" /LENGTH=189 /DNA_ID=CAMNT_0017413101 /DNA_START=77 /DNA_END=646 /DNA_ORIENTATION=-